MKKIILTLAIMAVLLAGCMSQQEALDARRDAISWAAFCTARGYELDNNTYQVTNEYLDTWCGSTEEEAAFIAAGVKPY